MNNPLERPQLKNREAEVEAKKIGRELPKGQINLAVLVGYTIVFIIYVVGFYPIISQTIQNATNVDPLSASILSLVPAAFFIAMIVGLFNYALGRRPSGAWGGE